MTTNTTNTTNTTTATTKYYITEEYKTVVTIPVTAVEYECMLTLNNQDYKKTWLSREQMTNIIRCNSHMDYCLLDGIREVVVCNREDIITSEVTKEVSLDVWFNHTFGDDEWVIC